MEASKPFQNPNWPTCPGCGARRMTCCPICGTPGNDFPPADTGFLDEFAQPEEAGAPPCCGHGSSGEESACKPEDPSCFQHARGETEESQPGCEESKGDRPCRCESDPEEERAAPVVCTTCDEPFSPVYLRRCEWCGHTFPSGRDFEIPSSLPAEEWNGRILAVLLGTAAVLLALAIWFALL